MQDDSDLVVGVIVPMFNSERTISATLKSICGQTHRGLDIVVVDDGSTDGSAAVAAAAEAVTSTTFGPGVSDMTEANRISGPSISCMR